MATEVDHITEPELAAWIADELSIQSASRIESHLEACDDCAQRLDKFDREADPLIRQLRQAFSEPSSVDTQLRQQTTRYAETGGPAPASPTWLTFGSRWHQERLLARGGIGEVWLARDQLLGRQVVVKRLRPETAHLASVQERFLREARITARLNHPGTAYMLDFVDDGASSYYVMSLVEGRTLTELIAEFHQHSDAGAKVSTGELFSLLQTWVAVAKVIAFAHLKGILHRDLKSDNVIVGKHGQVTVIDWGLAKVVNESAVGCQDQESEDELGRLIPPAASTARATRPGSQLGTPSFMAPEQARGDIAAIDHRTDVYGLAAMLYEILTGQPPFVGKCIELVIRKVACQPPTPPSELAVYVPRELEAICLQGLAKDKTERQQSASELAEAVTAWIADHAERQRKLEERGRFYEVYRSVVEHQTEFIVRWQPTGIRTFVNEAYCRYFDQSAEEIVGTSFFPLIAPSDMAEVIGRIEKLSFANPFSSGEHRVTHRDGTIGWMQWVDQAIFDEAGTLLEYQSVGRDVTDRKRAEEALKARLLNAFPDAVVIANTFHVIQLVNAQTERLFGYERGELVGRSMEDLIPNCIEGTHAERFASCLNGSGVCGPASVLELLGRHQDGSDFPIEISLSPLETDDGLLIFAAVRAVGRRP